MITRRLVPESQRLRFFPRIFGTKFLYGERLIYAWARGLCPDYNGGFWHFYTLDNGGFYVAPDRKDPMRIVVDGNGYDGTMSADAAGIVITLFSLCRMAEHFESATDHFHALRDFASEHPEAGAIFAAID
jgi:hypothetical protein